MGRLIDGDAMLARLEEWNTSDSTDKALYNFTMHRILEAPTIGPVRKGKWIKAQGMMPPEMFGVYYCSVCDGKAMRDYKSHKQILTDWCPHCGAKMEEPEDIPMEYFESGGR